MRANLERDQPELQADPERATRLARLLLIMLDALASGEAEALPAPAEAARLVLAFIRSGGRLAPELPARHGAEAPVQVG